MKNSFAPDWQREEHGWIVFPRDGAIRKPHIPPGLVEKVSAHPAKMNMHLCLEVIKYVTQDTTEPQTFLDPFGGAGTTAWCALLTGHKAILVEIEEEYQSIQRECMLYMEGQDRVKLLLGDNRVVLPVPADHIITSPPYGSDLFKAADVSARAVETRAGAATGIEGATGEMTAQYGKHPRNIGRLNNFFYQQEMDKLYAKMVKCIPPGGTITITHRDRIKDGERVLHSLDIMRSMKKHGMVREFWEKWEAPGSIQSRVNEKLGLEVVLDEDIMCFRKPV